MSYGWCANLPASPRRLGTGGLSAEDGRRIAFHIRFNRASSLFARCWLLVEGETETRLLMSWRVSVDIILMRRELKSLNLLSLA